MSEFTQPVFGNPPVVETVYGLQFDPLPRFRNAHLGAFWCALGTEWPTVADASYLPPAIELFDDELQWAPIGMLKVALKGDEASRIQIRNRAGNRMVQVQNGRFIFNWIRGEGERYPGAAAVRPEAVAMLARFEQFVSDQKLGPIKPNQWEVTYVNHFLKGTVWETPSDWSRLLNDKLVKPAESIDGLTTESLGGTWTYVIPPRRGRLHVEVLHGRSGAARDSKEALIMKLTARGPVPAEGGVDAGLKLGHDVVVHGFKRLLSESARNHWGEESA